MLPYVLPGGIEIMIDHETRKATMFEAGKMAALALQETATTMDGTQLNAAADVIPDFLAAKAQKNMLERKAGLKDGFVCKSSAGRVVRLLQPYDSETYQDEPEMLPAQWGFVWSNDPAHARPFIALATSPYMTGNVCEDAGKIYRSTHDNNTFAPTAYPDWWEEVTV